MTKLRPIMLVEDSPKDVELTIAAFKKNNFANPVVVLRDGAEALDYLRGLGTPPSMLPIVMLLDLKLPKKDGLQVLSEVKSDVHLRVLPVVMLTSSNEEADLVRSYRLGANAYVVKPVSFTQFVEAIKETGRFWAVVNEPPPD